VTSETRALSAQDALQGPLDAVADRSLPAEDRGAVWAVLHQIQLRINRVLKANRDDLIIHMEQGGLREMGPLYIRSTAIDVKWPINDPGNWTDETAQGFLHLVQSAAREYVREVPAHLEIDTKALGEGVAQGDPVAKELHARLKANGYRTEEGRRLSLAVREALAD
jgi:hypothetical protein